MHLDHLNLVSDSGSLTSSGFRMAMVEGVFESPLQKAITESKVLVVGAGGIGCELLKNIVLTGERVKHAGY